MKLHLISLDQDLEKLDTYDQEEDSIDWHYIVGQIHATKHLLSVATDIMNSSNERVYE
jgi:hypothetical protein